MREIELTQGQVAIVDESDYEQLSCFKWYAKWDSHTRSYYAARNAPNLDGRRGTIRMHRELCGLHAGDSRQVDHANHNTLDNRRSNLRIAEHAENVQNRNRYRNGSSGFKGVSLNRRLAKWVAYINVNKARKHLGYFATPERAAAAYNEAAIKHHGAFALLNSLPAAA